MSSGDSASAEGRQVKRYKSMININSLSQLVQSKGSISALLSWPVFSVTSYNMVSSLLRQGVCPKTVIDVGANVGQFAISSAKLFSDVSIYSFEPNPECVNTLQKNVRALSNVRVYPVALGDSEGEVTFHVNSHSHSSSILPLADTHKAAFPDAVECRDIKVKMSTLDAVMSEASLKPPVLLKLDVQGYETQVLSGAGKTLERVDYVILEASFKPMYEGEKTFLDVISFMGRMGFEFMRPVGWLSDDRTGEILQADLLFRHAE